MFKKKCLKWGLVEGYAAARSGASVRAPSTISEAYSIEDGMSQHVLQPEAQKPLYAW